MDNKLEAQGKSLDHFGVIASEMKRLKIPEMIDQAVGVNSQELVTTGDCVMGMVMNCFGFLDYPLMLMPEFFEDKALSCLFREGVDADNFNRHKLGRVLDRISNYGCEKLFSELSFSVCMNEGIGLAFQHCDTTTFSLTGEYLVEDMDVQEVVITRGYSKDQRRDCKQVVQELIVSQDGGVPLLTKSWSGNASDSKIFQARIRELVRIFKKSNELRCLIADSKLYSKENAEYLSQINFITRIPSTIKLEGDVRDKAIQQDSWIEINENYKAAEYSVVHYGFAQRWIVIYSTHAYNRAVKSVAREVKKKEEEIQKKLFHLQAKRFSCEEDARKALNFIAKKQRYHTITEAALKKHKHHAKRGRPTKNEGASKFTFQIVGKATINQEAVDLSIQRRSCFVLGTNMGREELSCEGVLNAYKQQDKVEKGFAFLTILWTLLRS